MYLLKTMTPPQQRKVKLFYFSSPNLLTPTPETKHAASAVATMKRIKEKSQVNEFLRKERDKRRRKMIVDQAKLQRDVEVRKREQLVLQKLEQQSKQVSSSPPPPINLSPLSHPSGERNRIRSMARVPIKGNNRARSISPRGEVPREERDNSCQR